MCRCPLEVAHSVRRHADSPAVVTAQGWEYTVLERELGAHRDPLRKMLVTVRDPSAL